MRNSKTRLFALIYYNRLTTLPYRRTIVPTVGLDSEKALGTSLSGGSYVRKNIYIYLLFFRIYIPSVLPLIYTFCSSDLFFNKFLSPPV